MGRRRQSAEVSYNPGDVATAFFPRFLTHHKGEWAGLPFNLLPWEEGLIRRAFGTLLPDGRRQYRTVYVEVPRKNGKSQLAAGVGLRLLFEQEPGAEVYSAACDRSQAAIVFDAAKGMVEASPVLRSMCRIYRRSIVVEKHGASYQVLSADVATKHGLNAHGVIFDEVHAQPNRELWDVLTTSTGARRQPLVFAITTAGVFDPESICWQLHEYAEKVRDGVIVDPSFLPVLYGAGLEDDWTDPVVWTAANPSLGTTISREYLERECGKARETPGYQNAFRRLHLCQWTAQDERWLDLGVWDGCAEPLRDVVGRPCFAGLDLSSTTDLSALVLVFPDTDGTYDVLGTYWIPRDTIVRRSREDGMPYVAWDADGAIEATPGNVVDYTMIRAKLGELAGQHEIREVGVDPWNATQLTTDLQADGHEIVSIRQGFASMSPPSKELEKLLLSRRLRHGGDPVLRWMASNVAVRHDPTGNIRPDKARSRDRIDGIVALIMALDRATRHMAEGESVYERAGSLSLVGTGGDAR